MQLGFHVSKEGRLFSEAILESKEWCESFGVKFKSAQIFVMGPQNVRENVIQSDRRLIKNVVEEHDINLVVHGAYVNNPWGTEEGINRAATERIAHELAIAHDIGAKGVIIHLGKGLANNDYDNLRGVLEGIETALKNNYEKGGHQALKTQVLYLEINPAKPSEFTFESPEKLQSLFTRIQEYNLNLNVGLCIDTAHLSSCGLVLSTANEARDWLSKLPKVATCMHLNDSVAIPGTGKDIHAALTKGVIWDDYNISTGTKKFTDSGLYEFIQWANKNKAIVILERNIEGLLNDLPLLKKYI